jgi:hypothetical protein
MKTLPHIPRSRTTYEKCKKISNEYSEKDDCAVIALAVAGKVSYEMSHAIMRKLGREDRKCTNVESMFRGFEAIGATQKVVSTESLRKKNGGRGLTINNVVSLLDKTKNYVGFVKGHVFAVRKGTLEDFTAGRRFKILFMLEVNR